MTQTHVAERAVCDDCTAIVVPCEYHYNQWHDMILELRDDVLGRE